MARTLSAGLTTEMAGLERDLVGGLTAELWLPEWTARISGLSVNAYEQYAHGHAVAVAPDANGAGEDIIFRARSGSYANPRSGALYISILRGTDLDDPTTWDGLWTSTGVTGIMHPTWTASSGAYYGGSIDVVVWNNAGTWTGRVFFVTSGGSLRYRDYNLLTGALIGSTVTIANLGTGYQLASMQIGVCTPNEVFVLSNDLVESGQAAWHKDLYGTNVVRYVYSGGWSEDTANPFPFHTCMEGGAVKDCLDYDDDAADTINQWGKRPCGGMAVHEIDTNTVLVSFGAVHWRRRGYWTNNAAIRSFLFYRDSGWWREADSIAENDFLDGQRVKLPMFAKASVVGDSKVLVFSCLFEPSDFEQDNDTLVLPRNRQVVWGKVSDDGLLFTHFKRLGDQDNLTGAGIVLVNHNSTQTLYALGWRSVYESEMCAALGEVDSLINLGDLGATNYEVTIDNRLGLRLSTDLADASLLYDGTIKKNMLLRAYLGTSSEQVQIGQGWVEQFSPDIKAGDDEIVEPPTPLQAYGDHQIQITKSESLGDVLSQGTVHVAPQAKIRHLNPVSGIWQVEKMNWPGLWFSGEFSALDQQWGYRLKSYPFAATGADILTEEMGSWFNDIAMVGLDPRVDGAIEASLRFGDDFNQSNFTFPYGTTPDWVTIERSNGYITRMRLRQNSQTGSIYSTANFYAMMGGLICHAPEIGRKYMFIWEGHSDISTASHANDTYTSEVFGYVNYGATAAANRLYLVISDYDGSNRVNTYVDYCTATGLTPGKPADLKMHVVGGTIYCFYRYHSTGTPNQYRLAFEHKSGRFGASSMGIIGRSQGGLRWNLLRPSQDKVAKTVNYVDFWNIQASDGRLDHTLEEHLKRHCWTGWTEAQFEDKESEASRSVTAGTYHRYDSLITNPTIDFKVSIPANGNEAGVFVRGMSSGSPTNDCIKIGLVAHNTANTQTNTINYYLVKRRYSGGAEVTTARQYSPMPLQIKAGKPIPVRVTVRGNTYSIWLAGNYAGHFRDETALGKYFGLYATGGTASFTHIRVPELYEIPIFAALKPDQSMASALRQALSGRRVKAVFQYNGVVKFSYFETPDTGPSFEDTLEQSSKTESDRSPSAVRVDGPFTFAEYVSEDVQPDRRYVVVYNPTIYHYEQAYHEARMIYKEMTERDFEMSLTGPPDLRVQPEDKTPITVSLQNVNGDYLVDDVQIAFDLAGETAAMKLGVRALVVL